MAERLTYWNDKEKKSALPKCINDFGDVVDLEDLCYKLACLEDILEKYGIEDLEQYLQRVREIDKELRDTIQQLHTIIDTIGYDRDTWKRACELACEREDDCYVYDNIHRAYEFYQQAKTEGNDDK